MTKISYTINSPENKIAPATS